MFSLFMQIISTAILMTRSVPEVDYKSQKVLRSKSISNHLEISNFILLAFFISWISPTPSAWVRRGTPGSAWPPGSVSPDQAGTNIYQICLLVKSRYFFWQFSLYIFTAVWSGQVSGSCAQGFGSCCLVYSDKCGGTLEHNNTYIREETFILAEHS